MRRDLDDMHRGTRADRDRGEFEADKPGADDDHFTRRGQPFAQNVGIGQGAQRKDAVELGARHRQCSAARSGRQHEMVAFDHTTRGQAQAAPRPVDRRNRVATDELDPLLFVKRAGPQQQFVETAFAGEIGFRQGWALVREPRLVADQHDAAGETLLAQ